MPAKPDAHHASWRHEQMLMASGASRIVSELRQAILDGVYRTEDRLPAERQLAQQFGSSRGTVREALRRLEAQQLVERKVGSGTFVKYNRGQEQSEIAEATSPVELLDVRVAIEPQIVRLAIANASAKDLLRLERAVSAVELASNAAEFTQLDARYHQILAECTRNPLMQWLYNHLNAVRSHRQWDKVKDKVLTPQRMRNYNLDHRDIYKAIAHRDVDTAVRIMIKHLQAARNDLLGETGV